MTPSHLAVALATCVALLASCTDPPEATHA